MSILELLKKLPKREFNELKEKFSVDNIKELSEKLIKRIDIIANYGTDSDLETINDLFENKKVHSASSTLVDSFIVYKDKNSYYLTEEAKGAFEDFELEAGKFLIHINVVEYYLLTNGALKKNEIIKLCKESGYNVTEEELEIMIGGSSYVVKDDIVYYGDELDITYNEVKKRKVANCFVMDMVVSLALYLYPIMVSAALEKHLGEDEDLNDTISERIVLTFMSSEKSEKMTKKYLKDINFKLSKDEKDLLDLTEGFVKSTLPIWSCGGHSAAEASNLITSEEYQEHLHLICEVNLPEFAELIGTDMTEHEFGNNHFIEDKDAFYVYAYVTINGVIGIAELEDRLKNHHNIKLNKKQINLYADAFNILHDDKYLYVIPDEEIISMIKFSHNVLKNYKVIDDPYKMLEHYNSMLEKASKLIGEYVSDQELVAEILMILAICPSDIDSIKNYIKEEKIVFKKGKNINELTKKLEKLSEDMPGWMLCGYTEKEIKESKMMRK